MTPPRAGADPQWRWEEAPLAGFVDRSDDGTFAVAGHHLGVLVPDLEVIAGQAVLKPLAVSA
jgi:hypothetical protein